MCVHTLVFTHLFFLLLGLYKYVHNTQCAHVHWHVKCRLCALIKKTICHECVTLSVVPASPRRIESYINIILKLFKRII